MRLLNTALCTTIAVGLLAGCSGATVATPPPVVPNAETSSLARASQGAGELGLQRLGLPNRLAAHRLVPGVNVQVAIRTADNKNYVSVTGYWGVEMNCGSGFVALHDNATRIGPWEKFTPVYDDNTGRYAFRTSDNVNYLTAVKGGGIGGPSGPDYSPLQTVATKVLLGFDYPFTIIWVSKTKVAIQTPDGKHYITAVNGGGCGPDGSVPFNTNRTRIGSWEEFLLLSL